MKLTFYIALLLSTLLFAASLVPDKETGMSDKKAELVVREIGHHLLLRSGDSTSAIPPVTRLNRNTFRLEFKNEFKFLTDTLINVVHRRLSSAGLPLDYRVSVTACGKPGLLFGYEMNTRENDVLPCMGRDQPTGCYLIDIEFTTVVKKPVAGKTMVFSGLFIVLILGVLVAGRRYIFKPEVRVKEEVTTGIPLGSFIFDFEKKTLKSNAEVIDLSEKEARILKIFAENQNQTIERDRLLKEVWEDEGVFVVGRSLDVFVSKLRKKLQHDPRIKISNIHSKGYKLEVEA